MEWIVTEEDKSCRLDVYLLNKYPDKSRSHIKHWIEDGVVTINDKCVKAGYSLRVGDRLFVGQVEEKVASAVAQDIPIDIMYEDDDMAIINKGQGMVVHPAVKNYDNTLVNALMYRLNNLSSINGVIRPGIVHRLDKDTSGLLVVAKNDKAHIDLSSQIQSKECRRIYLAICEGVVKQDGEIITQIGRDPRNRLKMAVVEDGKLAHTIYRVKEIIGNYSLVEFELKTGRTHQIRVHSAHIHHPIVGDPMYNNNKCKFKLNGQLLHAKTLILRHPTSGEEMQFDAPLPEYFARVLDILRQQNSQKNN